MASITCGNCKQTHSTVADVKACYAGQSEYAEAIRLRKGGVRFVAEPEPLFEDEPDEQGNPTVVYIPATEPGASTRNKNGQTIPGFYKVDDNIYKVTPARASDRTFAHRLVTAEGEAPEWEYLGLGKRYVPTWADKLTLAEAKEYGHTHGYCLICGRLLTAEQSVADGIGPVCAGKL